MWAKTKKPVNWVANKASCTPITALDLFEAHFNSLLGEMKKALSGKEVDYRFRIERKSQKELVVSRVLESDGGVLRETSFTAATSTISVRYRTGNRHGVECLVIGLKWDFNHAKCRFEIDNECFSLWKLSQRTLYDLFFGTDDNESPTHFKGKRIDV